MRTTITQDTYGDVTITADDDLTHERLSTIYYVPQPRGYVRERRPNGSDQQVCALLSSRGWALTCSRDDLLQVIRREYHRARRRDRQDRARRGY